MTMSSSVTLVCQRRKPRLLARDAPAVPRAVCGICAKLRAARSASVMLVLAAHQRDASSGVGILVSPAERRCDADRQSYREIVLPRQLPDDPNGVLLGQEERTSGLKVTDRKYKWPSGGITYSAGTDAANGVGRVLSRWDASASRRGQTTLPHRLQYHSLEENFAVIGNVSLTNQNHFGNKYFQEKNLWNDVEGSTWPEVAPNDALNMSFNTHRGQPCLRKTKANCLIEISTVTEQRKLCPDAEVLRECPHVAACAAPH